jgi:integrase
MKPTPSMPLLDFAREHYAADSEYRRANCKRGRVPGVALISALGLVCHYLQQILGRTPLVADLTAATLAQLREWLTLHRYSASTISCSGNHLLTLWRYAAVKGIVPIDAEHQAKRTQLRSPNGEPIVLDEDEGTLWHYCLKSYFPTNLRIRSDATVRQYRYAVGDFKLYLGHDPTAADLTDDNLAAMAKFMLTRNRTPRTVNERLSRIKTLWTFMARRDRSMNFPTVQRMKSPKRLPRAWTRTEIDKLYGACGRMPGRVGELPAADWWAAILAVVWDTGERIGAVLACRWEWLDWSTGDLRIPAESRKGCERDMAYRLHRDTLLALRKIQGPGELIFPWPYSQGSLYDGFRRLLKLAGLKIEPRAAFHKIRRSVASHLQAGGYSACEALGHSTAQVTKDSYLDPRIVGAVRPSEVLFRPGVAAPVAAPEPAGIVALDDAPEPRRLPRAKAIAEPEPQDMAAMAWL